MTEVAFVEAGSEAAEPLVLSNSLGTAWAMWDPQLPALAERFRLIRYDHRGHGASPVPPAPYSIDDLGRDVLALLDRLEIERVSFCGLSIGGMVGQWLAINAPERLKRLVIVCSSPHMPPPSAWADRAAAVRAGGTEAIADAVLGRWLTPPFADSNPDVAAWLRSMLVDTLDDGYAACCGVIEHLDLRDSLSRIAAPTLVIGGEFDPSAPPDQHGRLIADRVPGARFELVPAAHLANVESSELVTELIIEHLEEQS